MIPGFALDGRKSYALVVALRRGAHHGKVAVLSKDEQLSAREHHLAVAVAAPLPLEIAGGCIDAGEDVLVQAVDESFVKHRARKLVFHPDVSPDLANRQPIPAL